MVYNLAGNCSFATPCIYFEYMSTRMALYVSLYTIKRLTEIREMLFVFEHQIELPGFFTYLGLLFCVCKSQEGYKQV